MTRPSIALMAAMGLVLGCGDSPTSSEASPEEAAPVILDLTPLQDVLVDPLVSELIGDLTDQSAAGSIRELSDAVLGQGTELQLMTIHGAFDQVQYFLQPQEDSDPDEVLRAILGLIEPPRVHRRPDELSVAGSA